MFSRDATRKIRRPHYWGFAATLLVLCGCGRRVIDPGVAPMTTHIPVSAPPVTQTVVTPPHEIRAMPVSEVINVSRRDQPQQYHTVRSGETLSGIARQYGISLERLLSENGLDPQTPLQPDQLIYIPPAR